MPLIQIFQKCKSIYMPLNRIEFKRAGGLHQDFFEIDFLVFSDRGELE